MYIQSNDKKQKKKIEIVRTQNVIFACTDILFLFFFLVRVSFCFLPFYRQYNKNDLLISALNWESKLSTEFLNARARTHARSGYWKKVRSVCDVLGTDVCQCIVNERARFVRRAIFFSETADSHAYVSCVSIMNTTTVHRIELFIYLFIYYILCRPDSRLSDEMTQMRRLFDASNIVMI